jgi:hypothetical protein
MRLRRVVIQSLVISLVLAGFWTWSVTRPSSIESYLVAAAILFVPIAALQMIVRVGGALLDDERARAPHVE